ncbi:MAG: hypothetical protein WCC63_03100 [Candidatus Bathyarchaeia archaeon]
MKCPKCDKELSEDDIIDKELRGYAIVHYVYTWKKCDYIIGCGVIHVG